MNFENFNLHGINLPQKFKKKINKVAIWTSLAFLGVSALDHHHILLVPCHSTPHLVQVCALCCQAPWSGTMGLHHHAWLVYAIFYICRGLHFSNFSSLLYYTLLPVQFKKMVMFRTFRTLIFCLGRNNWLSSSRSDHTPDASDVQLPQAPDLSRQTSAPSCTEETRSGVFLPSLSFTQRPLQHNKSVSRYRRNGQSEHYEN